MNFNENGEEKSMSIHVDKNEAEELINVNESEMEKKEQPRNMKYAIVVTALVVVNIPKQTERSFRCKPNSDSGANRITIPL